MQILEVNRCTYITLQILQRSNTRAERGTFYSGASQILCQCKCKCNMKCKWNFALPHITASRWEEQCKGGRRSIPWSNQVRNLPPLVQNFMQAPLFDTTFTAVSRWLLITVFSWQARMDIFIWGMIIRILCWVLKAHKTKIASPHFHNTDNSR